MRKRTALIVIFHQYWPWISSQAVYQRRCRNGASEVRDDSNKMCLTYRCDLHHFCDAPDVRQSGTNVVDRVLLHQWVEIPTISPLLSCGQRHIHLIAKYRDVLQKGFGAHRIFNEERVVLFD